MMHARVTTLSLKKGKGAEAVEIYKNSILPAAKAQKGFRGSIVLADWETDKGLTLTFWESEKDALASEENCYYQEQLVKVFSLFASPPIREGFDVAVGAPRTPRVLKK